MQLFEDNTDIPRELSEKIFRFQIAHHRQRAILFKW